MSVLFVKANRFISKEAMIKEKKQIKKDIQERVIYEGPRQKDSPDQQQESDNEFQSHQNTKTKPADQSVKK